MYGSTICRHEIRKKNRRRPIRSESRWENRWDVRGAFAFSSRSNDAEREKLKRNTGGRWRGGMCTKKRFFVARRETGLPGRLPPGFLRAPIRFEAEHTRPPVPQVESVQIFVIATDLLFLLPICSLFRRDRNFRESSSDLFFFFNRDEFNKVLIIICSKS